MNYRLIYLSEARGHISTESLGQILDASHRNNPPCRVTGLLLFLEGQFFQVLEGPVDMVRVTYRRIGKDKRHHGLRILQSTEIHTRAFPDWSMGYARPETLTSAAKSSAFALRELVPPNSELRGEDPVVRKAVRDFMAQFARLRV